jgi:hypothetical protein
MHRDEVWKSRFMFPVIVFSLHYINTKARVTRNVANTHLEKICTPNSSMSFPFDNFAFQSGCAIIDTKVIIVPEELGASIL